MTMILKTTLLCLSLLILTASTHAEIYKWVDANGVVHFSDEKPANQKTEQVEVTVTTYESVSYDRSAFDAGEKVIMYSTSWCGYCKKARQYFQANGIQFVEYDIEKSQSAKRAFDRLGAKGVPVILVGSKRMNGFSEAGFRRIYE